MDSTVWLRASSALWPGHYCELENPEFSGPSWQHKSWNSVTFPHFYLPACSTAAAPFALSAAPTSGLRNLARSMCLYLPLTDGATVKGAAAVPFSIFVPPRVDWEIVRVLNAYLYLPPTGDAAIDGAERLFSLFWPVCS